MGFALAESLNLGSIHLGQGNPRKWGGMATSGGILIPRLGHTFLFLVGEVCLLLGNTHRLRAGPSITLGLGGQKTYHVTPPMPSDSVNECVTVGCKPCAP